MYIESISHCVVQLGVKVIFQICLFVCFMLWHDPAVLTAPLRGSPFKGMDLFRLLPVDILGGWYGPFALFS